MGLLDARKIDGTDHYLISPEGEVISLERNVNHIYGHRRKKSKIVKSHLLDGYPSINIRGKLFRIHRLLALAFIPNPENKPEVNHKNGIRNDNRLENLEWATHPENCQHAYDVLKRTNYVRKVNQLKDGIKIKEWGSVLEAERSDKRFCSSSIVKCCRGKASSHKGYQWEYVN